MKPLVRTINGRKYTLWNQFVDKKNEYIGGILEDHDNDPLCKPGIGKTVITDIRLEPNGESSAYFSVDGKDFGCGFDVRVGGIDGSFSDAKNGWIGFRGYGGHQWRIQRKEFTQ